VVVPCEDYRYESLYKLTKDITKKFELIHNLVVYQNITGLYNQKVFDPNEATEDCELFNHDSLVDTIKKWMMIFKNHFKQDYHLDLHTLILF